MSIGYEPQQFSFEQPEGTESFFDRIRILSKVALKEVSLVLFPMNPGAAIDPSTVKAFIAAAQDTDPSKLSVQTKVELRKLASRIGILLKKDPTPPTNPEDADEEEADDPPPTPKPADPAPSEDVADEAESDSASDASDEGTESKTYEFQEALAQRLKSVTLKHKVSNIGSDTPS
jgi:hypothetical protein